MLEQVFFITASIILFGIIFFKMIKNNDMEYIYILIIQAVGIILDGFGLIFEKNINKVIIYITSVLFPIVVLFLEYKKIDVTKTIKILQIKFYLKVGNTKKAKEILTAIVEKNPRNYMAHKYLAEIYEKEGGLRKAIDEYVICIEINKKDYDSYFKVATLLKELDKKDESIEMLTSLLAKKPDYYDATLVLGDLLIENNQYKEAVNMLTESLKYNPLSFEINYELGLAYTMLNDFKSAKEFYEKAAEINTLQYISKYYLAEIALLYKEIDIAEKYFEETIEDEDLQADSYYELAKISLMKGKKENAIKFANIAIDMDSKKISEKIKKEPLFIPILAKIAIPFNLEEKENTKLSNKEIKIKEHLENTSDITMNMGYIKPEKKEREIKYIKEREN